MLGNYEKAILIPHQWPQPQNNLIIAADSQTAAGGAVMAQDNQSNQNQNQNQNQSQNQKQEALMCPRCKSSNTKFCYYNNYSLSQPRHFCKACKRYWTRGGTLRNVPVGGVSRKNKRVKKPASNISSSSPSPPLPNNSGVQNHVNHLGLLYEVPMNPNPKPNPNPNLSYGVGLAHNRHHRAFSKQIFQDLISSSNPLLMSSFTSNSSSILDMKGSANNFGTILPSYGGDGGGIFNKEVKVELEGQNSQMDQNNNMGMGMGSSSPSSSDPSLVWGGGGTSSLAAWLDPSNNNLGSSVPSLILNGPPFAS